MPIMGKEFHFKLDSVDLGQVLDGLRCRQESWANTAIYLHDEYFPMIHSCAKNAVMLMKRKGSQTRISGSLPRSKVRSPNKMAHSSAFALM